MAPKRKSASTSDGESTRKRKAITMDQKVVIIKSHNRGNSAASIGRTLGYSRSTVATIIKDKERIMDHVKGSAPMQATIITKKRSGLLIEMERLLIMWLEDQHQRNIPVSLALVQEKARTLFSDLKAGQAGTSAEADESFIASRGWFMRFKERANLHNIKLQGEAASADTAAASEFPDKLADLIREENYLPQQIFNVDETGLFWKKMPQRTYIAREEKSAPGFKAAKDRLTLLFGGNAAGDCKLKPLLIYRSENPRALKRIIKASLPVIWKSNSKAWVTKTLFEEWFLNSFVPSVERYCANINVPFKILLVLDNAPGHPHSLNDLHPNVKVVFLPPNTTSLLQPMDQGVIASFKSYYLRRTFSQAIRASEDVGLREFWKGYNIYDAIKNIADSWEEVKITNMRGVWKKLCPQFAADFQGFTEDAIQEARRCVVEIGMQLELEINDDDVQELLDSHGEELTNDELIELEKQILLDEAIEPDPEPKEFTTKGLAEAIRQIEGGLKMIEEEDPNTERFLKVYRTVMQDLRCYTEIYDEKKKATVQTSLDRYFKSKTPPPAAVSPPPPAAVSPPPPAAVSPPPPAPDSPPTPSSSSSSM